ncbi:MAG: tetrahydromethanopterin S-methyltransferase subunit A [Euryarchaeota archaeon]|nr:tetrahydromethanopterin S-methyltransferase subunit A [Euryarchaeota archaeon]MCG2737862.1 tetrahydromethanopterin S-methyltransferase subunit A [Candidatus Methanoperedenaceae archaeon]
MLKVKPKEDYPLETGCYLSGNPCSPVAVVALLTTPYGKLPADVDALPVEVERLVKTAVEVGAALAGTLQTENIGIEKIIANIASNPNIRYIVLCGKDSEGHYPGGTLKALIENGINKKRTIIGAPSATPYLFNIPIEAIDVFRKQVTLVDMIGEENHETVAKAVWSCYQEEPTEFKGYSLYDSGAYSEEVTSFKLGMKVAHPEMVEEWELDEIIKDIEDSKERIEKTGGISMEELKVDERPKLDAFISQRLLRIAEELKDIAELLGQPVSLQEKKVMPVKSVTEKIFPTAPKIEVEEDETSIYFINQLRGYNAVFAAFHALKNDMCGAGLNLPVAVNKATKNLEKLKRDLEASSLPAPKKNEIGLRIDDLLKQTEKLPTELGPCQKTAGNCKIGVGCFAYGALDVMKLITEPKR